MILGLLSIADDASDDDDLRLRKRIGVAAGILTVFSPISLPIEARGHPASFVLAVALSAFSIANLGVLARTRRFDRYVVALIAFGTVWVPLAHVVGGGITGTSPGLVWAFLVPAYAILALGPRQAVPWFVAFLVSLGAMAVTDSWARDTFGSGPYPLRVIGWVINVVLPLSFVFLLLRFSDIRRRAAEARADELLTNAIPAPDRNAAQARRAANRRGVRGDHRPVRRHRRVHSVGEPHRSRRGGRLARRPLHPLRCSGRRARCREAENGR